MTAKETVLASFPGAFAMDYRGGIAILEKHSSECEGRLPLCIAIHLSEALAWELAAESLEIRELKPPQ